jgi:hypothetical protein
MKTFLSDLFPLIFPKHTVELLQMILLLSGLTVFGILLSFEVVRDFRIY